MTASNGHFDLDAKRAERAAAAAEAAHDHYAFTFGGKQFHIAPSTDWPARGKYLLGEGDLDKLLDLVLDDPAAFWELNPTMADVKDLLEDHARWSGVEGGLGEAVASQPPVTTPT